MTLRKYGAALAVLVVLLSVGSIQAESTFKSVPGLMQGHTPQVLIADLVPSYRVVEQVLPSVSGCDGSQPKFGSTSTLDAVAGPLGVSHFLRTNEDPDCDDFWECWLEADEEGRRVG